MSPGEAIAAGAASGVGVTGLGLLIVRHLVSKWLEGIDNLPTRLEEVKAELMDEIEKLRGELAGHRAHGDDAVESVRRYAETELNAQRAGGHTLREKVGLDIGVLSNRVDVNEREIREMKNDIRASREDLHRVDANVILIASKVGVTPLMPGQRQ
jgi:hypothetical protein